MKAIVHIGMHKTGSSSIQDTIKALDNPPFRYAPWHSPNHSAWFALLFEPVDRLAEYHAFRNAGRGLDELLAERRKFTALLEETLASGSDLPLLISAEAISGNFEAAVQAMAHFLMPRCSAISVIGYVRRPVSFLQSAFQQRLKGELNQLNGRTLWPNYRHRFEKIDRVFGRENVTLAMFDPAQLVDGDVVADFFSRLGVAMPPQVADRANESLSLEATALLFAQRKYGAGFVGGYRDAHRANQAFIDALATIGSEKMRFSPAFVDPLLKRFSDDLDWINQRMGESVLDAPQTSGRLVSDEDDLMTIALENAAPLARIIGPDQPVPATQDQLLAALEALRQRTAAKFDRR